MSAAETALFLWQINHLHTQVVRLAGVNGSLPLGRLLALTMDHHHRDKTGHFVNQEQRAQGCVVPRFIWFCSDRKRLVEEDEVSRLSPEHLDWCGQMNVANGGVTAAYKAAGDGRLVHSAVGIARMAESSVRVYHLPGRQT